VGSYSWCPGGSGREKGEVERRFHTLLECIDRRIKVDSKQKNPPKGKAKEERFR
jgi:hypothetical protein